MVLVGSISRHQRYPKWPFLLRVLLTEILYALLMPPCMLHAPPLSNRSRLQCVMNATYTFPCYVSSGHGLLGL